MLEMLEIKLREMVRRREGISAELRAEIMTEAYEPVLLTLILARLRPAPGCRCYLDERQRAMVAAKLANLAHGGDRRSDQAAARSDGAPVSSLRASAGVSPRSLQAGYRRNLL